MARYKGTSGDDVLLGGDDADRISGRAGNDTLGGGGGNDVIRGGLGYDTAYFDNDIYGQMSVIDLRITNQAQDTGQGYDILSGIENVYVDNHWEDVTIVGNKRDNVLVADTNHDVRLTGLDGNTLLTQESLSVWSGNQRTDRWT